jgi:diacylglycerol kinase family enzyme
MHTIQGRSILIRNTDANTPVCIHYDGEAAGTANEMRIEVAPKTLKVVAP